MLLRSKVQEMILRRRSRSMRGAQHAGNPSMAPCLDAGGRAHAPSFASPRMLHSASLPTGSCATAGAGSPMRQAMSPTSVVLVASAAFGVGGADRGGGNGSSSSKRRPWCDGCTGPHGLADALDCALDGRERRRSILAGRVKAQAPALVRSCSLDRRVEFGVKNKSSWLPLRLRVGGRTAQEEAVPAPEMEPSSEDYTCVISRGPNPRTVHIFGDRVVEGDHRETSPRQITNLPAPARGDRGFLSSSLSL